MCTAARNFALQQSPFRTYNLLRVTVTVTVIVCYRLSLIKQLLITNWCLNGGLNSVLYISDGSGIKGRDSKLGSACFVVVFAAVFHVKASPQSRLSLLVGGVLVLAKCYSRGGGGGGQTGMFVVSLRGVNFGFWSRLGCFGQSANILCRQGLV